MVGKHRIEMDKRIRTAWRLFFALLFLYVSSSYITLGRSTLYAQGLNDSITLPHDLTFSEQADFLYNHLIKLPVSEAQKIFKTYSPVISRELDMENLYYTTYQKLKHLLDSAVYESVDVLTLFTLGVEERIPLKHSQDLRLAQARSGKLKFKNHPSKGRRLQ